jgi:signal transduction histidine kinase
MVAALYGGLRAGALTTVLSAAAADYFWMEPVGSFVVAQPVDWLALGIFIATSLMICWLAERLWRAEATQRGALERAVADRTQALRIAMIEAQRASEAKSRFLAVASHDLRQPFQAVRLFWDVLDGKMTDAEQRKVLGRLGESINSTEALLNELLDVSKIESGGVSVNWELVAPGRMVRDLVAELAPLAANKGLKLRVFTCADALINSDRFLLRRILLNLVTNAIRYTEIGGVLVGMRRRGGHIAIEVWDTGIGIAPKDQELVFEDFYRVDDGTHNGSRGTGLGLAIVRRLCGLLQHEVSLVSRPGRGSVFRVMALVKPRVPVA